MDLKQYWQPDSKTKENRLSRWVFLVVIFTICLLIPILSAQKVQALDLDQALDIIKQTLFQKDYLSELETGEFLLEAKHEQFQVYFGDREKQGHHRVKMAKENLGFEFSFVETKETPAAPPSEESPLSGATSEEGLSEEIPEETTSEVTTPEEPPDTSAGKTLQVKDPKPEGLGNAEVEVIKDNLSQEQEAILGELEEQLQEIEEEQASIAAKLQEAKQEVESIDKVISQTIPGTNIGFDELSKNQMVVKNSQVEPSMDIYYWKRENDLREKIIFRESPAPSQLVFSLDSQDLTPFDIGAGVIYFKDENGDYVFRITKGYIKDLTGAFSNDVNTIVEDLPAGRQGGQLIHTLDPEWLSDPERVYPLTLYFDFQLTEGHLAGPRAKTIKPTPIPPEETSATTTSKVKSEDTSEVNSKETFPSLSPSPSPTPSPTLYPEPESIEGEGPTPTPTQLSTLNSPTLTILNPHSSPKAGENWTVSFETMGTANLIIIPDDQATVDDLDFVSLICFASSKDTEETDEGRSHRFEPEVPESGVITVKDFECSGVTELTHLVKVADHHTLKFQFGDQVKYAYNSPDTLYENYDESNVGINIYGDLWKGQTFTPSTTHVITYIRVYIGKSGSPATLTCGIRATGASLPTGSDLTSCTIPARSVPTSPAWVSCDLTDYDSLSASIQYAIVCRCSSCDAGGYYRWGQDSTSPTYTGGTTVASNNGGSSWASDSTKDQRFEEWGNPPNQAPTAPTLLRTHETDTTSGDTNPVAVGDTTPVFSAQYNDPDTGDVANKYCIQVNTASDFSGTDMWVSDGAGCGTGSSMTNCTEGDRCSDFTYAGTTLRFNGVTYYWRIRYWDNEPTQGAWSSSNPVDNFTILGPDDQMRHGNYFYNRKTERKFTW